MKVVGLTGGIASGKSTVSAMLQELGAVVIDADRITHELEAAGSPVVDELAEAFGAEIVAEDGGVDRAKLGALVFRDAEARARLNAILHPKIGAEMARRLDAARRDGAPLVVLDAPVLLESMRRGGGVSTLTGFDEIVLVYVPEAVQLERQMERDGSSQEEAMRRIRAQIPIEEKRTMVDTIVDNSGSLAETRAQVEALVSRWLDAAASG